MVFVSVGKITHGTVGATFNVAFSVPIDELSQLRELHDKYAVMNMMSFRLNSSTADTPQTEAPKRMRTFSEGEITDCGWK